MPNEEAHANVLVEISESWTNQEEQVSRKVEEALGGEKVDAVICVAGGWAGGNAASKGAIYVSTCFHSIFSFHLFEMYKLFITCI